MKHIIWIFLLISTLSACTTSTAPTSVETKLPPGKKQLALKDIHNWRLNGKIAVQTSHDSGSATVNWIQRQSYYSIALSGPLGSHSMLLMGQPGTVTLKASDGKSYHASSPEQLLAAQWGFNVPVSHLNYWIRGLPVPGISANTRYDQYGRLIALTQQGWHVEFLSYADKGGLYLPDRLSITSSALKVKIIVYDWQV